MRKIIFVTGNKYKVEEARVILSEKNIQIEQNNCGYPELQSDDLAEIAKYGAEWASRLLGMPVMVDDSGLFIKALSGFPGPYSAYVSKTIGNKGILKLMEGEKDRTAVFKCSIAYCEPSGEPVVFEGSIKGNIAYEIRGQGGFGYDPVFEVKGVTFGEMIDEKKNAISHRYNALVKFAEWIAKSSSESL